LRKEMLSCFRGSRYACRHSLASVPPLAELTFAPFPSTASQWTIKGGVQNFVGYKTNSRSLALPRAKLLASPPLPDDAFLNTPLHANRVASCGPLEIAYARDIAQFMESASTALAAAGLGGGKEEAKKLTAEEKSAALRKGGSSKRPMLEVQDMGPDDFCDTVVQVSSASTSLSIR
jgi:hypothetical protein